MDLLDPRRKYEREQLIQSLDQVTDDAMIPHHDHVSEESFQECILCGGWDEHMNVCPIPAIETFLKQLPKENNDA